MTRGRQHAKADSAFSRWFVEESGWGQARTVGDDYKLAEYVLARDAWLAALNAVEERMPEEHQANYGDQTTRVRGWNRYRREMSERTAALLAEADQALRELLEARELDPRDIDGAHKYEAIVEDAEKRARAVLSKLRAARGNNERHA